MGALKAIVIARGFVVRPRSAHPFLIAAILLDFGYAAMLGFGRSYTGLDGAVSSRYQYLSWFCFAPFLGIVFANSTSRTVWYVPRRALAAALLVAWAVFLIWPWRREAEG